MPEELRKKDSIQSAEIQKNKTVAEKLDNGLRVILNRNNDLPFINISLIFKGGVLFEPADRKGLTHFLSKMLLAGTDNKSKEEILSAIENKGGTISAFAGNNSFGITIEIFKQDFSECMGIIKDILINSEFHEKEIKKVRIEVLQEIKAIDEKIFGIGKKILFKEMYEGYDYSSLNVGNEKSIQNIKKEDLKKHYSKLVVPANGVLSISGDISLSRIKEDLKKSLGKWTRKKEKLKEKEFLNLGYIIEKQVEEEIDKTQSLLFIAYYGLSVRNDDRIKAELLWHILNGQGSRLFTNLREKKELAYYAGMFPFYGLTTGLFVFYAGTVQDKLKLAQEGILEEINNIIKNGISDKEFKAGKQEFLSEKIKAFQANSSIAFDYALEKLYNNRILTIADYKNMLDEIDLKSINKFIQSYFSDKPYKVIILKGK